MNDELRNIIIGISETSTRDSIQTVLSFLRKSKNASREIEKSELFSKTDEVEFLRDFAGSSDIFCSKV